MLGFFLLFSLLPAPMSEAAPTVRVQEGGRADRATGTMGAVLIQATKAEASPCGNAEEYAGSLSEEDLPPQTDLMRMIAERNGDLDGSLERTKECMTPRPGCGYWMVNPHETLDGEENDGDGETFALTGYTRSLPRYVLNFKIFDQKRYHESAETAAGLAARAATDESKAQAALAGHLRSLAEHFREMQAASARRAYPYQDLPLTISSLEEYAEIAEKREKLLAIVACHTKRLAGQDHEMEEEVRRSLTSLTPVTLTKDPVTDPPAISMGNSGLSENEKKPAAAQSEAPPDRQGEITRSFDAYAIRPKPASSTPAFTDEDTLFRRVHYQMRKRALPGELGPLPMGVGSVDGPWINREFQLERY